MKMEQNVKNINKRKVKKNLKTFISMLTKVLNICIVNSEGSLL